MAAGFPAGEANGHHLVNRYSKIGVYLEIGERRSDDEVNYPDDDLVAKTTNNGRLFTGKDGTAYS